MTSLFLVRGGVFVCISDAAEQETGQTPVFAAVFSREVLLRPRSDEPQMQLIVVQLFLRSSAAVWTLPGKCRRRGTAAPVGVSLAVS